jgi:uncharacterized phage infection (PIP) family protein YhgE
LECYSETSMIEVTKKYFDESIERVEKSIEDLASITKSGFDAVSDQFRKVDGRLVRLEEGQVKLEEGQVKLEEGQVKLEGGLAKLEERQTKLEEGQQIINGKLDRALHRQLDKHEVWIRELAQVVNHKLSE